MEAFSSGFALRSNGTCQSNENDCGRTVSPYHACCTGSSVCLNQDNTVCCPTKANCTNDLLPDPQCANRTWDLYFNGGYFCCEPGTRGYAASLSDSDGCGSPVYKLRRGEVFLYVVSSGKAFSTPTSLSQSQSSSTASLPSTTSQSPKPPSTPSAVPDSSSSSNTGAIAGGVVGGVVALALIAALIWIALRRRARVRDLAAIRLSGKPEQVHEKDGVVVQELMGQHGISELSELPHGQTTRAELE